MSDVLIKGMKMPKDKPIRIVLNPNGQLFVDHGVHFTEYEAVELPPHGRLIDADALEEKCHRLSQDEWNKSTGTTWGYAYATFESDVEDAPTIIGAEDGT